MFPTTLACEGRSSGRGFHVNGLDQLTERLLQQTRVGTRCQHGVTHAFGTLYPGLVGRHETSNLAVFFGYIGHTMHGRQKVWVIKLPRDAHEIRQVKMTHPDGLPSRS